MPELEEAAMTLGMKKVRNNIVKNNLWPMLLELNVLPMIRTPS